MVFGCVFRAPKSYLQSAWFRCIIFYAYSTQAFHTAHSLLAPIYNFEFTECLTSQIFTFHELKHYPFLVPEAHFSLARQGKRESGNNGCSILSVRGFCSGNSPNYYSNLDSTT